MSDKPEPEVRRIADKIARYEVNVILALVTGLLGVIIYFYGSMPEKISALTHSVDQLAHAVETTNLKLNRLQDDVADLKATQPVAQSWRERQLILEGKVDRHTEQIGQIKKDVDDLKKPLPWMRGPAK